MVLVVHVLVSFIFVYKCKDLFLRFLIRLIYIDRERERERQIDRQTDRDRDREKGKRWKRKTDI